MSEFTSKLECLKKELSYGEKQLIKENDDLKEQIEVLKQEKHSLLLKLDAHAQMIDSQNFKIEEQTKASDLITETKDQLLKENTQINRKLKENIQEITDLREDFEELVLKNKNYEKKIQDLQHELRSHQEKDQLTLNETNTCEELFKVHQELSTCKNEKKELLSLVSELESKLYKAKLSEQKLAASIQELQDCLQEKNEELQSYLSLIEKTKEENVELIETIEMMKLEQVDEKRRGNSVFGEVDDRRKAVEMEYITMKEKYKALKESHDNRLQQLQQLRNRLAIALRMPTNEAELNYVNKLETKLVEARKEIEQLAYNLSEQKKIERQLVPTDINATGDQNEYGYLVTLLQQSEKKNELLQAELKKMRFLNIAETDKLIDVERSLYQSKKNVDMLRRELLKHKLQIEELSQRKETDQSKTRVEKIPGFVKKEPELCGNDEKPSVNKENKDLKNEKLSKTELKSVTTTKTRNVNTDYSGCAQQ